MAKLKPGRRISDSLGKKTPWQAAEPTLSGGSSEDRALWRLSLVLREISENAEPYGAPLPRKSTTNQEVAVPTAEQT